VKLHLRPNPKWRHKPAWSVLRHREELGGDGPLLSLSATFGVRERVKGEGRAASEDTAGYRVVFPGDVVINRLVARDGAISISNLYGQISPAYWVLVPEPGSDARFINYLLNSSPYLAEIGARSKCMPPAQFDLPWEQFRTLPIPCPDATLQRAIADYLDAETARIDALIGKKLQMKEVLEEREAAERDAMVLSVGDGSTCSLRRLLREAISDGPHETPDFVDDGVPFLSVDNIVESQVVFDGCRMISEADHVRYSRKLRPGLGDVLITKAASVGKVALVADRRDFNIWSPIAVLRTDTSVLLPEFLWQYLRTRMAQRELSLGSTSNTQQNISMRDLGSLRVPVVPIQDQRKVCEQISEEARGLLNTIEDSVAVLRERRQALITAAVTGEIEVPRVAA